MKTKIFLICCAALVFGLLLTGCAHYSTDPLALIGTSTKDLEMARDTGITREVALSKEEAFNKTLEIIKAKNLTVYQKSLKKGLITVMGFPKQSDTTEVGIFFSETSGGKTLVTASSLSSTALAKAGSMILDVLAGGPENTAAATAPAPAP